jgi:hypothetical protein
VIGTEKVSACLALAKSLAAIKVFMCAGCAGLAGGWAICAYHGGCRTGYDNVARCREGLRWVGVSWSAVVRFTTAGTCQGKHVGWKGHENDSEMGSSCLMLLHQLTGRRFAWKRKDAMGGYQRSRGNERR